MIQYYVANELNDYIQSKSYKQFSALVKNLPKPVPVSEWMNIGGQLIPQKHVEQLLVNIENNKISSWNEVHSFYETESLQYQSLKLQQAISMYKSIFGVDLLLANKTEWKELLMAGIETKEWIYQRIVHSREKDYTNPFRQMVFEDPATMDAVVGKFEENSFIIQEDQDNKKYKKQVQQILKNYSL